MARHGYDDDDDDDDDFDIVDADGWNQYDPFAMRRAPQQPSIQHDAADDHEGSPGIWWENQLLCFWRCHR